MWFVPSLSVEVTEFVIGVEKRVTVGVSMLSFEYLVDLTVDGASIVPNTQGHAINSNIILCKNFKIKEEIGLVLKGTYY